MRLRGNAARVFDFVSTCPGSTLETILHELGGERRGAIDRLVHRMRANGILVVSIAEDELTGRYTVNPGVEVSYPTRKRKRSKLTPEQRRKKYEAQKEYMKQRRERANAEHKCVNCLAGLPDDWKWVVCPEHLEMQRGYAVKYNAKPKARQRKREYERRLYARDRERILEGQRQERIRRKIAGQCQVCASPATSASSYCVKHLMKVR